MKTCWTDQFLVGRLFGGDVCCFLENHGHDKQIQPLPLVLNKEEKVPAGTCFTRLGNGSTSGGNGDLFVKEGFFLEYQGIIQSLDGNLVVFYQVPGEKPERFLPCYWYNIDAETGNGYLIHVNRANASRVVHLEKSEYKLPKKYLHE